MAISINTIFECNASATANNVNGGGFNRANANMLTDLACDSNTGNTDDPIVSSASYNFAAGDVGHWVFIKSGTNWTPGWYKISATGSNKATLMAAIGEAVQISTTTGGPAPRYSANTVAGCGTAATPTSGTWTMDYSQSTAAVDTGTDLACADGDVNPSVITSASHNFTAQEVGNVIHITAGTGWTAGWYEIVSVATNAATLDRAVGTDGAKTSGTWYLGGAMSLNSTLDDDLFELGTGTNGTGGVRFYLKNGSFSTGEAITLTSDGGTQAPVTIVGYNALRGDTPTGTNRPTISIAATAITLGDNWEIYNVIVTGTTATNFNVGANNKIINCKIVNTSATANRNALTIGDSASFVFNSEFISYRGRAISSTNGTNVFGCFIHDSDTGIYHNATGYSANILNNIVSSNVTGAINIVAATTSGMQVVGNTLFGSTNTTGTGLNLATGATNMRFYNNIITGFATGVIHADTQTVGFDDYNNYYNNDADVTKWQKGVNSVAVDQSFTSVSQVTGTAGAFVAGGSKLVDTSKNFTTSNVAAGDVVYIVSGTGVTAGQYLIDSISTTTNANDTLNITIPASPGTDTTADKVYQITIGNNYLPTGNI
jgi:hypothetical protein